MHEKEMKLHHAIADDELNGVSGGMSIPEVNNCEICGGRVYGAGNSTKNYFCLCFECYQQQRVYDAVTDAMKNR